MTHLSLRIDGRSFNDLRPLVVDFNPLSRSGGSARFEMGHTIVLCAIHSPIESNKQKTFLHDRAYIDVLVRPSSGQITETERLLENIVRQMVEQSVKISSFPRSVIRVVVQPLNNDGSLITCCINAVISALLSSGLPMNFTPLCVSVGIQDGRNIVLDPCSIEDARLDASWSICFSNNIHGGKKVIMVVPEIIQSSMEDTFLSSRKPVSDEVWCNIVDAALASANIVETFYKKSLKHHLKIAAEQNGVPRVVVEKSSSGENKGRKDLLAEIEAKIKKEGTNDTIDEDS